VNPVPPALNFSVTLLVGDPAIVKLAPTALVVPRPVLWTQG